MTDAGREEENDQLLWKRIQRGEERAFDALYRLYVKRLFSYGSKICHDRVMVEDCIHDVFLDLWRYRQSLSDTTSVKFYLFGSLRRRITKNQTKELSSTLFDFGYDEHFLRSALSQEDEMVQAEKISERVHLLKKHLHNLSPRQYESLVLRFYEDFSYEQIGALLDVNQQSARNLVQRGLEQLRHIVKIVTSVLVFAATLL